MLEIRIRAKADNGKPGIGWRAAMDDLATRSDPATNVAWDQEDLPAAWPTRL